MSRKRGRALPLIRRQVTSGYDAVDEANRSRLCKSWRHAPLRDSKSQVRRYCDSEHLYMVTCSHSNWTELQSWSMASTDYATTRYSQDSSANDLLPSSGRYVIDAMCKACNNGCCVVTLTVYIQLWIVSIWVKVDIVCWSVTSKSGPRTLWNWAQHENDCRHPTIVRT